MDKIDSHPIFSKCKLYISSNSKIPKQVEKYDFHVHEISTTGVFQSLIKSASKFKTGVFKQCSFEESTFTQFTTPEESKIETLILD